MLLFPLASGTGAMASALDDACAAYNNHDYSNALRKLDTLPSSQHNAKSGYYRGLTLQALHRYGEANDEYRKVATQRKDLSLANLARQGMIGLSHMPKQRSFHEFSGSGSSPAISTATASATAENKISEGGRGNWKVAEPGYGGQGVNKNGMPEGWTFVKTSNGCGRH